MELKYQFENILSRLNIERDKKEFEELTEVISRIGKFIFEKSWANLLNDQEWPNATDPITICDINSEEQKNIRASAIYSILVAKHIASNVDHLDILDFGCGEGHLVKHISNCPNVSVSGYDIQNYGWEKHNGLNLTTELQGLYDVIIVYDVLDHCVNEDPIDVLKKIKSVLKPTGKLIVRCHPWCSRHGTHHWTLNKAYAHFIFTEEALEKLGHKGIPTRIITHPRPTYNSWFTKAGFRVLSESPLDLQAGTFFERNLDLRNKILSYYPGMSRIKYDLIEHVFIDYVLQ